MSKCLLCAFALLAIIASLSTKAEAGTIFALGDFTNSLYHDNLYGMSYWNGKQWSKYNANLDGTKYDMIQFNGSVYLASSNALASTLSKISYGPSAISKVSFYSSDNVINVLEVGGNKLWFAGSFQQSSSSWSSYNNIAYMDTFGTVHPLHGAGSSPAPYPYEITALAYDSINSNLFVGAQGGSGLYVYDVYGQSWSSFPYTFVSGAQVNGLAMDQSGNLYIVGNFQSSYGDNIISYNVISGSFSSMTIAGNVYGQVNCVCVSGSDVYIGGSFYEIDGSSISTFARYSNGQWTQVGSDIIGSVNTCLVQGSKVYIGGSFTISSLLSSNVAYFDTNTNSFHSLSTGLYNSYSSGAVVNKLRYISAPNVDYAVAALVGGALIAAIVGPIAGCIFLVCLFVLILICCVKCCRSSSSYSSRTKTQTTYTYIAPAVAPATYGTSPPTVTANVYPIVQQPQQPSYYVASGNQAGGYVQLGAQAPQFNASAPPAYYQ